MYVCIYIYIERERERESERERVKKMRGWTTSVVKKIKKFNENVSVRDLQLFTTFE